MELPQRTPPAGEVKTEFDAEGDDTEVTIAGVFGFVQIADQVTQEGEEGHGVARVDGNTTSAPGVPM